MPDPGAQPDQGDAKALSRCLIFSDLTDASLMRTRATTEHFCPFNVVALATGGCRALETRLVPQVEGTLFCVCWVP